MIDLAYIQKQNGEYINETAYSFWYGCHMLGIHTVPYVAKDEEAFGDVRSLDSLELRKDTLVHGHIGCVLKALKKLEVLPPEYDGGPVKDIESFYGRNMWPTTMKEVRYRLEEGRHIFIKPLKVQKAFTGFVTSGEVKDLIKTAGFEDDFEILASDVVEFITEYRLFIHNGLIIGCKNYRGDFTKLPDFQVAQDVLNAFKNQPVAFSLDLGVTDQGQTLVVEINDFYALGAYGLPSIPYTQAVISRWEQMVGL
jgi:hypothetical protein